MTLLTVLKLLVRFNLVSTKVHITINRVTSRIIGTTANLKEGDVLQVEQLLYGMMLPSGNDAAFALAEYFGTLLLEKSKSK